MSIEKRLEELKTKSFFMIIGAPKSGTTWTQHLLNGHPDVRCKAEIDPGILITQLGELSQAIITSNYRLNSPRESELKPGDCANYSDEELFYLLRTALVLLVTDNEMPDAIGVKANSGYLYTDLLDQALPKCKMIQVIRDGRDAITSTWHHNMRMAPKKTEEIGQEDFVRDNTLFWVSSMIEMDRWRKENEHRCLLVRYEDLINKPRPTVWNICYFLNVSNDNTIIDQMIDGASFSNLSGGRQRGDEKKDSFYRKGIIGDHKNFFTQEQIDSFKNVAGDAMRLCGYEI
jgi:hypothetical protein